MVTSWTGSVWVAGVSRASQAKLFSALQWLQVNQNVVSWEDQIWNQSVLLLHEYLKRNHRVLRPTCIFASCPLYWIVLEHGNVHEQCWNTTLFVNNAGTPYCLWKMPEHHIVYDQCWCTVLFMNSARTSYCVYNSTGRPHCEQCLNTIVVSNNNKCHLFGCCSFFFFFGGSFKKKFLL